MKDIASKKVPKGKLIKVSVDYKEKINKIEITGDFFLHPEEALEKLEADLTGINAAETSSFIKNKIDMILEKYSIEIIGFTSQDLADVIKEAIIKGEHK